MSTTSPDKDARTRWRTYLKAVLFLLPPILVWRIACVYLVPKANEVHSYLMTVLQHDASAMSMIQWLWRYIMFLVQQGWWICVALILILVFFEWFASGWPRYRRFTVNVLAWGINVAVLLGLAALLIVALYHTPRPPETLKTPDQSLPATADGATAAEPER